MNSEEEPTTLNRFTLLPELLDLLRRRKMVLLNPTDWIDKNDLNVIKFYEENKLVKIFVKCFCIGEETVHHWLAYAYGNAGCCIEFDKKKLLAKFPSKKGFINKEVEYKYIDEIESETPLLKKRLFIKRKPYQFEKEFRIICESKKSEKSIEVDIDLDAIEKITISPYSPRLILNPMRELFWDIIGNRDININRSTLFLNKSWIKAMIK